MPSTLRIRLLFVGLAIVGLACGCGDKSPQGDGGTPGKGGGAGSNGVKPPPAAVDVGPSLPDDAKNFDVFAKFCVDSLNWAGKQEAVEKLGLRKPPEKLMFAIEKTVAVDRLDDQTPTQEHRRLIMRYTSPPDPSGDIAFRCRVTLLFRLEEAGWVMIRAKRVMDEFDAPSKNSGDPEQFNNTVNRHTDFIRSLFDRTRIFTD